MRFTVATVTLLVATTVALGDANNFPSLLNPLGFLQQASQSVISTLMRSTQPKQQPAYGPAFGPGRTPRPSPGSSFSSGQGSGPSGPDMADRVASLVSNSLGGGEAKRPQQQQQQQQQQAGGGGLFGGFMRLLGLDSTRLGAIAINAFVYVSEMITATLTRMAPAALPAGVKRDGKAPDGSPFSWLLNNPGPKVAEALRLAQDRELPELLIGLVRGRARRALDEDYEGPTWCLQRLMCQLSPVLWGMQRAVADSLGPSPPAGAETSTGPLNALWKHLPTKNTLREQGDRCESRFPECNLLGEF